MATKKPKITYKTLTANYTKFVPITPKIYKNVLTNKERYYIRKQAIQGREDIREIGATDMGNLPQEIYTKNMNRIKNILSGDVYIENRERYVDNYIKGLQAQGFLGIKTQTIIDKMMYLKERLPSSKFDKLYQELPDLYLYYKDKKSNRKRNDAYDEEVAEDAIEQAEDVMDEYAQSLNEEDYEEYLNLE